MEACFEAQPSALVCRLVGRIEPCDVEDACRRLKALLAVPDSRLVLCDLDDDHVDLATVDALARLQLVAKRRGAEVRVRRAPQALWGLIELVGLADCVRPALVV